VLEQILERVPDDPFRLVGTASCVLRGIVVPATDVDVLFRSRDTIDGWVASLSSVGEVDDGPAWLADANQYFARLTIEDVAVELSTVEIDADTDTAECIGSGPWAHFDLVPCGAGTVPAVALELRLVTEVARRRPDRWQPIVDHLRTHPCDLSLVERGLAAYATPPDEIAALLEALSVP